MTMVQPSAWISILVPKFFCHKVLEGINASWLASCLLLLLISNSLLADAFMRGMTVSCPRWGGIWATRDMDQSVDTLVKDGVNWVAIHPYAGVEKDGSVRFHRDRWHKVLPEAIKKVRSRGLSFFMKPHLAYWGRFSWRGDITF